MTYIAQGVESCGVDYNGEDDAEINYIRKDRNPTVAGCQCKAAEMSQVALGFILAFVKVRPT